MVYPHMYFHCLYHHYPDLFRSKMYNYIPGRIRDFWLSQRDHPSYADHPMHRMEHSHLEKAVPLFLHGDEVAAVGLGKIWSRAADCISFGSLVAGTTKVFDKHVIVWMLYNCIQAAVVDGMGTMNVLWRHLVWSLYWLSQGVFPDRDPYGVLYTPADGEDYHRRLKDLAAGWSGQLWAAEVDNAYQSSVFHLSSESAGRHCGWCRASTAGALSWTDCSSNHCPWTGTIWTNASHAEAVADDRHRLFRNLPGFGVANSLPDILHSNF